ncbi:MAG: signal peptidase I [Nanoarchaeota archaeon]|nr:signal peptidase I [Nanoarchaeota archaeon]
MINWKKIWYFIWKEDSFASWLVNILLAIIIVKFLIYPGLGLLFNTDFPVVAVVSCSMEHKLTNCGDINKEKDLCGMGDLKYDKIDFANFWESCGNWYEDKNITKNMFSGFSFVNGFNKGDIMVLIGTENINVGDVIVFDSGLGGAPIIHRIVGVNDDGSLMTKGDHNIDQMFFERNINKDKVYGKAILKIPYLGWVKVIFNDFIGGILK